MSDDYFNELLEKKRLEKGVIPAPDFNIRVSTPEGEIESSNIPEPVQVEPAAISPMGRDSLKASAANDMAYGDSSDDWAVTSIAKGLVNGTIKAGESMSQLMADGMNLPIKAYEKITGKDIGFRFNAPAPATYEVNTVGSLTQGATQFGLQYYTGGNLLKAAKIMQGGTRGVSIAREMTKGVYADFTAFKGDEERLSNFLTQFNNPALNNVVTQYLAADEDDSDFEGRLKNVLEGGIVGAGIDILTTSIRGLKHAKRAAQRGDTKLAEEISLKSRESVEKIIQENADQLELDLDKAVEFEKISPNKAEPIEMAGLQPEQAEKLASRLKNLSNRNPAAILDAARPELGNLNLEHIHTFDDVKGVSSLLGEDLTPKFKEWSLDEQLEMAELYGTDLPTLQRYYKEGVVNENILLSSRMLFDAQSQKITDMIMKNVDDHLLAPEIAQWGEFLNMTSSFSNISGRTLGSHNIRSGLKRNSYEEAASFIAERFGGKDGLQKFKEAWVATGGDIAGLKGLSKQSGWRIATDSALELWKNGILSGFRTMGVNLLGNPLNLQKEIGQRFFQGVAGSVRGAARGSTDHVYMGESLAMMMAQIDSFTETLLSVSRITKNPKYLKDFKLPKSIGDKAERGYVRKISADNWGIGTAPAAMARYIEKMSGVPSMKVQAGMRWMVDATGSVINTPGNLLGIMDGHAQNVASRSQRYAMAYRKLMSEGASSTEALGRMRELMNDQVFLDNIQESVEEFAARSTFQGELGTFGKAMQNVIKNTRPLDIPVMEFLIPFTRTPINIFTQGVTEVNPVLGLSSVARGVKQGGIAMDEALGRYTFGMSMTAGTIMAVNNGLITGAGPSDHGQKAALMETGWRPYSIRVQDGFDAQGEPKYTYYQYNRLEPAAWLIGSVATMMETMHYTSLTNPNKDRDMQDYAAAYLGALGEATMDKSFFQGVSQFFETMSDPKRHIGTFLNKYAGSMVPAIVRDVNILAQETPYLRKVATMEDAINNRLLGGHKKLAVVRNRWGDPIEMDKGWFLGARSYFSPIGMSDKYAKPIDKEIVRLALEGVEGPDGEKRVYPHALPSMPQKYIERLGRHIRLDAWQYSRMIEIGGKEIKLPMFGEKHGDMNMQEALNHLVTRDKLYQELTDFPDRQAVLIRKIMEPYDKAAKDQVLLEFPELQKELLEAERYDMMKKTGLQSPEDEYRMLENLDAR